MQQLSAGKQRLDFIDMARGAALFAMAIYHFTWDLEFFGYTEPGLTATLAWKAFARSIASSFIFLAGVSLVLAHGNGLRRTAYIKRLAMIVAAALAITVASYYFFPRSFIFFGILHAIAAFSVIGLLFLRLPWQLILSVAVVAIAVPHFARMPQFDIPALWWVGLAPRDPVSNDYVPLFPWIGPFLIGMAWVRWRHTAKIDVIRKIKATRPTGRALSFAGRHSLAVYLLHQPILIAVVWSFAQFAPAQSQSTGARFMHACQSECTAHRSEDFCLRYCVCMLDTLEVNDRLTDVMTRSSDDEASKEIRQYALQCSVSSEEE